MLLTLATHNEGKKKELETLIRLFIPQKNVVLQTLKEAGIFEEIPETGMTFAENAFLKAKVVAEKTGGLALSDDSGLVVQALAGQPGVFSARYAGPPYSEKRNREKLLQELYQTPKEQRQAYFQCVLCLYGPDTEPQFLEGQCQGRIAFEESGSQGFGYDSLFIPSEEEWEALSVAPALKQMFLGKTFAELPATFKNQLSHRFKATLKLIPLLVHKSSN